MACAEYSKPSTGMAEKPDDRWAVPLCGPVLYDIGPPLKGCHAEQHSENEEAFWFSKEKNPFQIAATLYTKFGTVERERKKTKWKKPKQARPKPKRAGPKQKIAIRGFDKTVKRKIPNRRKSK